MNSIVFHRSLLLGSAALAFATILYLLSENDKKKEQRRKYIRGLMRDWVRFKWSFKQLGPVFEGIEKLAKFGVTATVSLAALTMFPLILLALGFSKLSDGAKRIPKIGAKLSQLLALVVLALGFLFILGVGTLIPIFVVNGLLPGNRARVEFYISSSALTVASIVILNNAPLTVMGILLGRGFGWRLSKTLSYVLVIAVLLGAWIKLVEMAPK